MLQRPKLIRTARTHASLLVILLIFIVLGMLYNISLPLFEAPDEMAHFRYVNWLATGHSLPNISADVHAVGHEVGQPPLYYMLLAPLVARLNTHDLYEIAPANPHRGGGIGVHYHTPAERFPYRNTALAVHLVRFASTLIAVVTILSTYGIARIAVPGQAALAAALVAFNPQFLFVSASVNNDNLVTALVALALLLLVWQLVPPRVPWWQYLLLGALWGPRDRGKDERFGPGWDHPDWVISGSLATQIVAPSRIGGSCHPWRRCYHRWLVVRAQLDALWRSICLARVTRRK